ncbi:MAG: hypothetical protein ACREHD_02545 [Pirellulales bacterium]
MSDASTRPRKPAGSSRSATIFSQGRNEPSDQLDDSWWSARSTSSGSISSGM